MEGFVRGDRAHILSIYLAPKIGQKQRGNEVLVGNIFFDPYLSIVPLKRF